MKKPIMAFWPYMSAFCNKHFCSGVVTDIDNDGNVETKNFGRGYYFKPVAFFPVSQGKALQAKLDALEVKHDEEQGEMRKRHFLEVAAVVEDKLPFKKQVK